MKITAISNIVQTSTNNPTFDVIQEEVLLKSTDKMERLDVGYYCVNLLYAVTEEAFNIIPMFNCGVMDEGSSWKCYYSSTDGKIYLHTFDASGNATDGLLSSSSLLIFEF